MTFPRDEIQATVDRYVATREAIDAGKEPWDALVAYFTDDVVFVDPAWGRVEGIEAFKEFLRDSMAGLDDWTFPVDFVAVEGDNVVVKWRQITPGTRPNGTRPSQTGFSHLVYAGGGKFRYEEDLLNMTHVMEDLGATKWQPPSGMNLPPAQPNRDTTIPAR
jgi:ketosteroid isomerase-like protein